MKPVERLHSGFHQIGPFDVQKTSKAADLRGWPVLTSQGMRPLQRKLTRIR